MASFFYLLSAGVYCVRTLYVRSNGWAPPLIVALMVNVRSLFTDGVTWQPLSVNDCVPPAGIAAGSGEKTHPVTEA